MAKDHSSEDRLLISRIEDSLSLAEKTPRTKFLGWLDGREQIIAENYLKKRILNKTFYGGHPQAERKYLAIWTDTHSEPLATDYPFGSLTATFREEDLLTHRDFLGALLHLQIKREAIGDLLVGTGLAVLFVDQSPLKMLRQTLQKVGNVGIEVTDNLPAILPPAFTTEEIRVIVVSPRLDAVVAGVTNTSRGKSALLIQNGLVKVNYQECREVSRLLEVGTLLSIRGYGRICMKEITGETRKGRLVLLLEKYK